MSSAHINRIKTTRRLIIVGRVSLAALGFVLLKSLAHTIGLDVLEMSPLFSALVAASVFLLGFLLNGVLSDYKESEKLPGELASALFLLATEVKAVPIHTPGAQVQDDLEAIRDLGSCALRWIKGEVNTDQVMASYTLTHEHTVTASTCLAHSSLKGRLMIEMAAILRCLNRIEVIRETDFAAMVYLLAYSAATILCIGLSLIKTDTSSFYNNSFFLFSLSWLLIFILHLISDLDNPFGFGDMSSAEDVDLTILESTQLKLEQLCNTRSYPQNVQPITALRGSH